MINLKLSRKEEQLFQRYAAKENLPLEDFICKTVLEKIEDEYDIEVYQKAISEFHQNPKCHRLEEVKKEYNL